MNISLFFSGGTVHVAVIQVRPSNRWQYSSNTSYHERNHLHTTAHLLRNSHSVTHLPSPIITAPAFNH
ncbi:hypothetical protein CPC08DRAFT_105878 [Agrocybe pediades]|nr:hypothetical protein CPC08DRAFT_105878 [Agrocybe pediades]